MAKDSRGKLYFTIGLPRSGKSSYANAWSKESPNRVVIGGDDFRIGLHGHEYLRTSEGLVFGVMDAAIRALLHRGFDVLVDETCTTEATLLRYLLIDLNATPIILDTPANICIQRAREGGKEHLVPCIVQMDKQKQELLRDWPAAIERVKAKILERYPNDIVR